MIANEIDPMAIAAMQLNAGTNDIAIETDRQDWLGRPAEPEADIVIAGDVCYEREMSARTLAWLRSHAAAGRLVLFGDPGSNRLIAQLLPKLPVSWTRERVGFAEGLSAEDHAPALIAPNPLNAGRYVVVNSGHTFGADAFRGTNALLYPRLGDYAVFRLGDDGEEVADSGYFGEEWEPKSE